MAATELSFYDRISDALANPDGQLAIAAGAKAKYDNRARAMSEFPSMEITRDRARSIRAHTLSQLDKFLAEFADNVEALGGHIFWAKDAQECNQYINEIARAKDVQLVSKAKSMLT